jgi:hypothetical protein
MSPTKAKHHCVFWLTFGTALLVAFLMSGILFFSGWLGDHRWYIDLVIVSGVTVVSIWSVWVVLVLKNIVQWWVSILKQIDYISINLDEACRDLKEIKKDIK